MKNSIINDSPHYQKEEIYQQFISKILDDFKENHYISVKGKILHYLPEPTIYFYITVHKKTDINPFNKAILFCLEFINGEIPYATILTDFIEPSMNDNRNYYRCLSNEYDYIFSLDKYENVREILKSAILGIKNFLTFIKESVTINHFVYFGEYEFNHIYQINDFLMNNKFYRIYEIKNKEQYEKFIIFTNLYFIIFQPLEFDKCLMKILFIMELNEMNLIFDKNKNNNSLILDLSETQYKNKLEFVLIDRKHIKLKNPNDFKFDKEKNDIESDYSSLIEKWFTHQNNNIILFKKYDSILKNYRLLFNEKRDKIKLVLGKILNIKEYNKFIDFYEKLLNYYETNKEKSEKNNERMHKIISDLIYLCSELVNYDKNKKKIDNQYLIKIKKYLNSYK